MDGSVTSGAWVTGHYTCKDRRSGWKYHGTWFAIHQFYAENDIDRPLPFNFHVNSATIIPCVCSVSRERERQRDRRDLLRRTNANVNCDCLSEFTFIISRVKRGKHDTTISVRYDVFYGESIDLCINNPLLYQKRYRVFKAFLVGETKYLDIEIFPVNMLKYSSSSSFSSFRLNTHIHA